MVTEQQLREMMQNVMIANAAIEDIEDDIAALKTLDEPTIELETQLKTLKEQREKWVKVINERIDRFPELAKGE